MSDVPEGLEEFDRDWSLTEDGRELGAWIWNFRGSEEELSNKLASMQPSDAASIWKQMHAAIFGIWSTLQSYYPDRHDVEDRDV